MEESTPSIKKNQRIKRKTADKILLEVIDRAKDINKNDAFLYGISEISIFGSYLKNPEKEYIGDLDILVKTERKILSWVTQHSSDPTKDASFLYLMKQAEIELPNRATYFDHLFYAYNKTMKRLKNRSKTLSIHDGLAEGGRLGSERIVFECNPKELVVQNKIYI